MTKADDLKLTHLKLHQQRIPHDCQEFKRLIREAEITDVAILELPEWTTPLYQSKN